VFGCSNRKFHFDDFGPLLQILNLKIRDQFAILKNLKDQFEILVTNLQVLKKFRGLFVILGKNRGEFAVLKKL
jgi:hypothetical protein